MAQVYDSRGLRILVKNPKPLDETRRWGGLVRSLQKPEFDSSWKPTRYLRFIFRQLPLSLVGVSPKSSLQLTPLIALREQTLDRTTRWLTAKLLRREMTPAFFTRAVAGFAVGTLALSAGDQIYQHQLNAHIVANVRAEAPAYDYLIMSDFRFHQIAKELANGRLTKPQAELEAYWINHAYNDYYRYRDSATSKLEDQQAQARLLDQFLFRHLKKIFEDGVKPMNGFEVPEASRGAITDAQKQQLFAINHALILRYQIIAEFVDRPQSDLVQDSIFQKVKAQSFDSQFGRALVELRKQDAISSAQMKDRLQEDAYWQARFDEWKTIGVTKIKQVYGKTVPITLDDVREEILTEILTEIRLRGSDK